MCIRDSLRADLLTGKRFLGGILVRIAGLDDQQLRAGLIEVGEVDFFCTLRGLGERSDADVDLTGLDGGDDAVERHVDDFELYAERIGDLLCQPDVAACEVGVEILELIRCVLCFGADNQLALRLDLSEKTGCFFGSGLLGRFLGSSFFGGSFRGCLLSTSRCV